MKKQVKVCISVALAALFLFSTGMVIFQLVDSRRSQKNFAQIEGLIEEETEVPSKAQTPEEKQQSAYDKYHRLLEENPDFYGWIRVPDTRIDYPVMYAPNRKDFYVKHNFNKTYSDYGVPFIQENCIPDLSDNLVIYGHNMKDNSMFSGLEAYASKDFYDKHRKIQFDTLSGFARYEVVAVFRTVAYTPEAFRYYDFVDAASEKEFDDYIAQCKELSLYPIKTTAEYGDRLITLSTCEYTQTDGRFVVVAKEVREVD